MKLAMPHDWYRADKGVADSLGIATAPISSLVADMVAIRSSKRRSSSASSLSLLAHNNTPLSEQDSNVLRTFALIGTHQSRETIFVKRTM